MNVLNIASEHEKNKSKEVAQTVKRYILKVG